jgi:hypothetical protein
VRVCGVGGVEGGWGDEWTKCGPTADGYKQKEDETGFSVGIEPRQRTARAWRAPRTGARVHAHVHCTANLGSVACSVCMVQANSAVEDVLCA